MQPGAKSRASPGLDERCRGQKVACRRPRGQPGWPEAAQPLETGPGWEVGLRRARGAPPGCGAEGPVLSGGDAGDTELGREGEGLAGTLPRARGV